MEFKRASGVLLHPTSLPGRFGCGDLGPGAYAFLDFLSQSGQSIWQVLPLGPTGYGDSPYQVLSSFAGNPLLISCDRLLEEGLLSSADLSEIPPFPTERVDYGALIPFKQKVLRKSFARFNTVADAALHTEFERFCREQADWLENFALFMALKDVHSGAPWYDWEADIATRQAEALKDWQCKLADECTFHKYLQFMFFRQWLALKQEAKRRGIRIVGDLPIFVAHDSADVWTHPELFQLDERGMPTVVAGVPPDYFSATGQLWGNPIYRWDVLREQNYAWWIARVRATLAMVDCIRLDHFRGFEAYWEVPAGEKTAINGRWVKGPGASLFDAIRSALQVPRLPIIAEDLGVITAEVVALREQFELPGMRVLQFAFGGGLIERMDPPYRYPRNCVVYTGTHDNDTTLGWFRHSALPGERELALRYTGSDGKEFHWDFIRLALSSVADMAVIPMQDILGLDSDARMNYPGRDSGNWVWRCPPDACAREEVIRRLADMTEIYGRAPSQGAAS
ncbi:MAG: 4-alpha-glucanotransferase [Anaerolineae bacterium]